MKEYEYPYEATIVSTDEANKVMNVLYTSPGRQDVLCGVRLPESPEDIGVTIDDAVPFGVWQEAERSVFVPLVGTKVKGIARSGAVPALGGSEAPPIPFYSPAGQGTGGDHLPAPEEEASGFPTRYVPENVPALPGEPEVNL